MEAPTPYARILAALCVWREARGESSDAKLGVAWVLRNRAERPTWWGTDLVLCILKPFQFSSFNHGDPNSYRFPTETDNSWQASLDAVDAMLVSQTDPTRKATSYFDRSLDFDPPKWATDGSNVKTVELGALRFYKRVAD
jgi:spore germination cell wall hydrolase CwlJ-like protein